MFLNLVLTCGVLLAFALVAFCVAKWWNLRCVGVTPVPLFTFIAILFTSGLDVGLIMFPLTEFGGYADDPAYAEQAAGFAAEVAARWVSPTLRANVIATQKSRRALHAAMEAGAGEPWDYAPKRDASTEYVRNHMDWTQAAARYRFPPLKEGA